MPIVSDFIGNRLPENLKPLTKEIQIRNFDEQMQLIWRKYTTK